MTIIIKNLSLTFDGVRLKVYAIASRLTAPRKSQKASVVDEIIFQRIILLYIFIYITELLSHNYLLAYRTISFIKVNDSFP